MPRKLRALPSPRPILRPIQRNHTRFISLFGRCLLNPSKWGYLPNVSPITLPLIEDILSHKCFCATSLVFRGVSSVSLASPIANLAMQIFQYLTGAPAATQNDYDTWHKKAGKGFIKDCAGCGVAIEFGIAQKFINLAMKHLYCYSAPLSHFSYCHTILDGVTYTGGEIALAGGFFKHEVNPGAVTVPWSTLTYPQYIDIQAQIRAYLNSSRSPYVDSATRNRLTPFEAEFYIWLRYK